MTRILVNTETKLQTCIEAIEASSIVTFDTETNGLDLWNKHHMVGIAFYCDFNKTSYYVPFAHGVGEFYPTTKTAVNAKKAKLTNERYKELDLQFNQLPDHRVFGELDFVLTPDKTYLCHNAQFDLTALLMHGVDLQGATVYDTMLAARVLYSDFNRSYFKMPDTGERERGSNGLKWLARLFGLVRADSAGNVGEEQVPYDEIKWLYHCLGKGTLNLDKKRHLWTLKPETVAPYACMDVELTYRLHTILLEHLASWRQTSVYILMCEHQINVAWRMNRTGFLIDHERGNELLSEYESERARLMTHIDFNINSGQQIDAYAKRLNVNLPRTPKGNPKADKNTLKKYQDRLPFARNILAVRSLDKNVKTYIEKWLNVTTPNTPLHFNFNVLGTVTGRWSSDGQQTPKDTKLKYNPKKLLLPVNPDHCIVEIDYSQLEMRVGAWVAETIVGGGVDMTLTNLILDGVDMHAYTRDNAGIVDILLNGKSIEDYMNEYNQVGLSDFTCEDEMNYAFMQHARQLSKVPNFAAMYGGGWQALTDILENITETQARDIMDGWKETYPTIVRAMTVLTGQAMEWRYKPSVIDKIADVPPPRGVHIAQPSYQYIQYPAEIVPFIRKWSYYSEKDKNEKSKDAFNSIVQGTSGFICVESINRVLKHAPKLTIHATVHDSLICSLPKGTLDIGIPAITQIMTDWPINPPLACDVEVSPVGKSWGDKEAYTL